MPMIYDMSEDVAEARRKQTYNAVDGDDFAEDDGDEVLGSDSRSLNAAAQDRRARDEDSPARCPWSAPRVQTREVFAVAVPCSSGCG